MVGVNALRRLDLGFVARRVRRLVLSLFVVVLVSFLMIHLIPGDPIRASMNENTDDAVIQARRHELGLDRPLAIQFVRYIKNLFAGNLGDSAVTGRPVSETITQRFPETLKLAVLSFVIALVIALPVGIALAGVTRGGRKAMLDRSVTVATVFTQAVPQFLVAVGLVWAFAMKLGWFPVAGNHGWKSYVLPVAALTVGPMASMIRFSRVETAGVLDEDYMRTARSKRLPTRIVYLRHALPNALTATLTMSGLLLGANVAGTVLVENVFAWPGLGPTVVEAIVRKDYPTVQAMVLLFGALVMVITFLVDMTLTLIDPRSRMADQ